MSAITQRTALAVISAAPTALAASPARPANDEWSRVRDFLERATPAERMQFHLTRAAEAINEVRPGAWRVQFGLDLGFVLVANHAHMSRQPVEAEGPTS